MGRCLNDKGILLCGVSIETKVVAINSWENDESNEKKHFSIEIRTYFGSIVFKVNNISPRRDGYITYDLNFTMGNLLLI